MGAEAFATRINPVKNTLTLHLGYKCPVRFWQVRLSINS